MPVYADLYQRYFNADDFKTGPRVLTIKSAGPENVAVEGEKVQLVLYFNEDARGLVLNAGNYKKCKELFGNEDTDAWIGGRIEIYYNPDVTFGGKVKGGARIRPALPPK